MAMASVPNPSRIVFAAQALLPDGWARDVRLTIADGAFQSVEVGNVARPGDERFDAIIPGMPNLHSHAFQRAFAGRAERRGGGADSFWTWREAMYRVALAITPDEVEAVAAMLYVEMLEAGFTRVGEFHYLHHAPDGHAHANPAEMAERIAAAACESGIGLTLLPVFYAQGGFGGRAPEPGQRRFINGRDAFARLFEASGRAIRDLPGARLGLAPHSLRAVTMDDLRAVLPLAGDGPVHIHVAEQVREVEDCVAANGARPVEWLMSQVPVGDRWCLIHATHMTPGETSDLARSGAVAGLCPITEANLGDGLFNAPDFLAAGGRFGIGSDSNVEISLGGELRMLEYGQRLTRRMRNVLGMPGASTGGDLFRAALAGGMKALGPGQTGLRGGAPADFVTLRAPDSEWDLPIGDDLLDALVFAPAHVAIDTVSVRGVVCVAGGRHVRRAPIAARFGAAMRALRALLVE